MAGKYLVDCLYHVYVVCYIKLKFFISVGISFDFEMKRNKVMYFKKEKKKKKFETPQPGIELR